MASRSMQYLRKHQKVILVFVGVICMVVFTVGSFLDPSSMFGSRPSQADIENPVVATWNRGAIRQSDLSQLRLKHNVAVGFITAVIAETIDRGGRPVVDGMPVQPDRPLQTVGFPMDDSDRSLVQTMILAEEAQRTGVSVNHDAVIKFLASISSPELGEGDWADVAKRVIGSGSNITINELFDQLAYELKAQHVRKLMYTGLAAIPPGQLWDYFNRLNRRFTIEAYPFDANDYLKQATAEPTETELRKLFDEGKSREPDPSSPDPGFHQPRQIAFGYLTVDMKPFLDEAKQKITDQQIEEQYKKDIEQGLHKELELPPAADKPPEGNEPAESNKPAETSPPADATPATPDDKPAPAKAEADAPAKPESPADASDTKPEDVKKPAEQSKEEGRPKEGDEGGCQNEPAADPSAAEPSADGKSDAEKPAEEKPTEEKPTEEKPTEEKPTEEKPAAEKPASDKPAEGKPADENPAADTPAADNAAGTAPASPAKEPKFKPLTAVRDEIATRLAQPLAQEARDAAIKAAIQEINDYSRAHRRWQIAQESKSTTSTAKDPGKLDLEGIAKRHGFKSGTTPLVDQFQASETELGKNVSVFDFSGGQFRMLTFPQIAFGDGVPLYTPQQADSSLPDTSYIYFRTQEVPAKEPTFQQARSAVLDSWKLQKAYELAVKDAEALAAKAKQSESLKAAVSDPAKLLEPPPFSWMSTGSIGMGFGQPTLSSVPGIDLAGNDFMRSVFALSPGEVGTASNNPRTKVYVVRVSAQTPDDSVLQEQFLETAGSPQVMNMLQIVGSYDLYDGVSDWIKQIQQRYDLEWQRPPDLRDQM